MKRRAAMAALLALAGCTSGDAGGPAPDASAGAIDVQVLSLSTWLGQLDPMEDTDASGVKHQYGGLAALSSYFAADRAAKPNTILVVDADSFGASPPLSSQFADEPAVDALGLLGVNVDSLSNHNFNVGIPYLQHLVDRSKYPYVASNLDGVTDAVSAKVVTPYALLDAGPIKVGVLAITDPDALNHTSAGRFGAITPVAPIAAANAGASAARAAGAQVVVAMTDLETATVAADGTRAGPLVDFVNGLNGVDVVIGYKQADPAVSRIKNSLVVEHTWKGRTYGRTRLHFEGGALKSASADVVSPDIASVTPDPNAVALLAPYRAQLATLFDGSVSFATGTFPLDGSERTGEAAIGDLVADAYLAKYAPEGAQIAVMNGAGIRDTMPSTYAPADKQLRRPGSGYAAGPPFDVVLGDAYTVLPFGDMCVVRPVTGAVLWLMLEQSVFRDPSPATGYLHTYQASAPAGARVQSVTLDDGTALSRDDGRIVQLVDTDYLDGGGDNYGMLVQATPAPTRDVAAEVLLAYLKSTAPIMPIVRGRITRAP